MKTKWIWGSPPGTALLLLALLAGATAARAERIPVRVYGVADGLPHERVRGVVSDPDGFLWFCTPNGLSRFDGKNFVNYTGEHGLPSTVINDFLTMRNGQRWVAAEGGACLLGSGGDDPSTLFTCPPFEGAETRIDAMTLFEDSAGVLWVGTARGLFRSEGESGSTVFRKKLLPTTADGTVMEVRAITQRPDGALWLGTSHGIVHWSRDHPVRYAWRPSGGLDWVRALLPDGEGRLWVGHHTGLAVFVPPEISGAAGLEQLALMEIHLAEGDALELPTIPGTGVWITTDSGVLNNAVRALMRSAEGTIWISQIGRGLTRFDGERFRRYTTDNGLSDDTLGGMTQDSAGRLWVGSDLGGVMRITWDGMISYGLEEGLGHTFINSILEDEYRKLWVISEGFILNRFDGTRLHHARPSVPAHVRDPYFFDSGIRDRGGEWWVPTPEGVFLFPRFDRLDELASLGPRRIYRAADGLPSGQVGRIFEDRNGDLWMTMNSASEIPLVRLEREAGRFHTYAGRQGLTRGVAVTSIAESPGGRLWVGLADGQVGRLSDGKFERFGRTSGVPAGSIGALFFDSAGRLWVGSRRGGLGRMDDPGTARPTGRIYGPEDGLASHDVRCVVEDRFGRIYVGTGSGVDRIDEHDRVRHFTTADGLANNEVFAAFRDQQGLLWFGTLDGLSRLEPRPEIPPKPPEARIASIRVGGIRQEVDELGQRHVSGLSVEPGMNNLQIGFFGLSPVTGERLRYEYRLNDRDAAWSEPTSERTVHFAALSPGRYLFEVRARSAAGMVSQEPATATFVVEPPFWRTAWFVGMITLLIAGAAYAAHRQSVLRVIAIERLRTRIATDLHDDIGANLTQIAFLSDGAGRQPGAIPSGVSPALERIAAISRETVDSMSDIVWAINPAWDRMSHLAQRMRRFASDLLEHSEILLHMKDPAGGIDVSLDSETKRQVYLIFKEAMSNLVRHAGCTRADVALEYRAGFLELTIFDDGKGFDPGKAARGNGLASMRSRAEGLRGTLTIQSGGDQGTRVTLSVPIPRRRLQPPT